MDPNGAKPRDDALGPSSADLALLAELARSVGEARTVGEVLDVAFEHTFSRLGVRTAGMTRWRPDATLEVIATAGAGPDEPDEADDRRPARPDDSALQLAIRTRRSVAVSPDGRVAAQDAVPPAPGRPTGIRSLTTEPTDKVTSVAVPLLAGSDVLGALDLSFPAPVLLSSRRRAVLEAAAAVCGLAIHHLQPPLVTTPEPGAPEPARRRVEHRWQRTVAAYALAIVVPVIAGMTLATTSSPWELLPGGWFLVPVVLAALLGGLRPAVVASLVSAVVLWWTALPHTQSWRLDNPASLAGAAGFAVGATAVAFLVDRMERSRRAAEAAQVEERAARAELDRVLQLGGFGVLAGERDDITSANDAFLAMVGYTRTDLATRGLRWTELTAPEWAHVDEAIRRDLVTVGVAKPAEKECLRRDGSRVPVLVTVTVLDPVQARWSALVADLSQRRQLDEVLREVETAKATAEMAARLAREHLVVEALQRAVLPERLPEVHGADLAACYVPAQPDSPIGGDWYDAVPLDDDRVVLIVGDVAGHGLGSVSVMGQLRNALRAFALDERHPDASLRSLNRFVRKMDPGTFATVIIGTYHRGDGRLTWTHAGHPPPLLFSDGRAVVVEDAATGGPLLGAYADPVFPVRHDILRPGDGMLFYTDGLIERRACSFDDGLRALATELARCEPADANQICTQMVERVLPQHPREDDLCQLLVRRHR